MEKEWKSGEAIWHMKQAERNALDVAAMNKLNEIIDVATLRQRVAELETYLKSETKDKESAQESFGTTWSEWQRCEKRIAQLERQRDELLAALKWIDVFGFDAPELRARARMAIASVKGGAA